MRQLNSPSLNDYESTLKDSFISFEKPKLRVILEEKSYGIIGFV